MNRIDVLAVMDGFAQTCRNEGSDQAPGVRALWEREREQVLEARDAVAALLLADRAYDLSKAHLQEVNNRISLRMARKEPFDEDDMLCKAHCQHSFDRAVDTRRTVLLAVQPSKFANEPVVAPLQRSEVEGAQG